MEMIKKFQQKHTYIFSFTFLIISVGLLYVCNLWIFNTNSGRDYSFNRFLAHLVPLIFVIGVSYVLGLIDILSFRKKGFGMGILLGWPFLADGIYGFVLSYSSLMKGSIVYPGIGKIIFFTLVMFLVGAFEEVICRGVILNIMLNKWGHTKWSIIKSVLLSSALFGLGHLINIFGYSTPFRTMTQIIYTFLNGILFAAIYLRCRNIWAVVVLHAVYDWLVLIAGIFKPVVAAGAQVDTSVLSMLTTGALYIPFALVGLFLLRKVYLKDKTRAVEGTRVV